MHTWFDGPLLLSGSIASGTAILATQAIGADLDYIGSALIATKEARWKDIWGCGQGIGVINEVPAAGALAGRLAAEYAAAFG